MKTSEAHTDAHHRPGTSGRRPLNFDLHVKPCYPDCRHEANRQRRTRFTEESRQEARYKCPDLL